MMTTLKELVGLAPEADEGAVGGRVLEFFADLAVALSLPEKATASQVKGAVAALKAGCDRFRETQEELLALKRRFQEETAVQAVSEALKEGKISPAQQGWAREYYRQDPEGFKTYVSQAPKIIPAGETLQLLKHSRTRGGELLPEEAAICRSLNLAPEAYLQAKAQAGQTR